MAVKKKSANPTPPAKKRGYGWVPDLPDRRDMLYGAPVAAMQALPYQVDLRPQCPAEVYDQGALGSCTANAIAAAIEFDRIKQGLTPIFTPSRLFIYYNERVMEGTVNSDSGAMIRDGIKSVGKKGAPPEPDWPYVISKFKKKPPASVYRKALRYKVVLYQRLVQNLNQMRGCLAAGFPFVFGFTVYESFESQAVTNTGLVPMPASNEQVLGGHAVLAVGYDDSLNRFIVRNSWGDSWGMGGYFTMPYNYLLDSSLSDDLWTIRLV
jgi:C1A family cysteine protease